MDGATLKKGMTVKVVESDYQHHVGRVGEVITMPVGDKRPMCVVLMASIGKAFLTPVAGLEPVEDNDGE